MLTVRSTGLTSKTLSRGAFKGLGPKTVIKVPSSMKKTYKKLFVKKGLKKSKDQINLRIGLTKQPDTEMTGGHTVSGCLGSMPAVVSSQSSQTSEPEKA